jgi:hypothetical protein
MSWEWQGDFEQPSHLGHTQVSQILVCRGKNPAAL